MPKMNQVGAILLSALLAVMAMGPAHGESAGTSSPAARAPAAAHATTVTPEEARRTLEVLQDDEKRARTIEMLRVIAGTAPPATQPAQGTPAAPHSPAPGGQAGQGVQTTQAVPGGQPAPAPTQPAAPAGDAGPAIASDSLGAQVLVQTSEWINALSDNIQAGAVALTHFPALWRWIERTASDPYARDRLLDTAWKLIAVFGCALLLEWLAQRAASRPIAAL